MISVAQALSILSQNRPALEPGDIHIEKSLGRRCAQSLSAKLSMPPSDVSAMDGYALKLADSVKGKRLTVIGEAPAGKPFEGRVSDGEAVRIFTGGFMPEGADNVVIQENCERSGETVTINQTSETARHIRKAGLDFHKGQVLIEEGKIIDAADIALMAAGNHAMVNVWRRAKVAILTNGDELRPPGSNLKTGEIVNSNMAAIGSLVKTWGGDMIDAGIAPDDRERIKAQIKTCEPADIIVPIGGASVGDYDYMKSAFTDLGFETLFSKVAVRPGKPVWFGRLGQQIVLGLPGNPASALVCAHLFLRPLITDAIRPVSAQTLDPIGKNGPRETYMRGCLCVEAGRLSVRTLPLQDSALVSPFTRANAFIRLAAETGPWAIGDAVEVLPLNVGLPVL